MVIFKFLTFTQGKVFSILAFLLSIIFLYCSYQNKKLMVNIVVENSIIKWASTVCVFSICLWYAKHKLNFDYGIELEYLNYSVYSYAFAMAIPLCLFIYGIGIFMHVYLGKVTAYQSFYSTILALPFCYLLKNSMENQQGIDFVIYIFFIISLPYGVVMLLKPIITPHKKDKKNVIHIKRKSLNPKRVKLILKIWFKKNLRAMNNLLRITDLVSIAVALLYVGIFSIGVIPEYQKSFVLLDAYSKTDCNDRKDSFFYLRKSSFECYKITYEGFEIKRMESFDSQGK